MWENMSKIKYVLLDNTNSQGGRGNFTYLLEGQIHYALKLFVGRPIKQF